MFLYIVGALLQNTNPNPVAIGDKIVLTRDIKGYNFNLSKGDIYTVVELNSNKYPIILPLSFPLRVSLLADVYIKLQ